MTEEQLNTMEALAKAPGEWGMRIEQSYALELIALARVGLVVQPRPISEAPKNETELLVFFPDTNGNMKADCTAWPANWTGKWPTEYMAYSGGPPTHFIPLSALPKPGGE